MGLGKWLDNLFMEKFDPIKIHVGENPEYDLNGKYIGQYVAVPSLCGGYWWLYGASWSTNWEFPIGEGFPPSEFPMKGNSWGENITYLSYDLRPYGWSLREGNKFLQQAVTVWRSE